MEEMFAGDPAVTPKTIVSSIAPKDTSSIAPKDTSSSCNAVERKKDTVETSEKIEKEKRPTKRRSRSVVEEPQWLEKYQEQQQKFHQEKMEIETRRVDALEKLVALMEKNTN